MATVVEREVRRAEREQRPPEVEPRPARARLPLGPLETIHVYWLAGMSCDGCT